MLDYFCKIHHVFVFNYFVVCAVDFEIVEIVNECHVAQTEVENYGVIGIRWGFNFQTYKSFSALQIKQTTAFSLVIL